MMRIKFLFGMTMLGLAITAGLMTGCEIDSAENSTRNPGIIVEGFYVREGGGPMVPTTTGNPIQNMNLMQNGDQLEAIDDNGIIFRGSLGQVIDDRASFTLRGQATSGQKATMTGNFDVAGTTSTMRGSWIEDSLVSTVTGTATVPENTTPTGGGTNGNVVAVNIAPPSATLVIDGDDTQQIFTASGGTGNFRWTEPTQLGTLSSPRGDRLEEVTFTARIEGVATLTVRDEGTRSDSVQVTIDP